MITDCTIVVATEHLTSADLGDESVILNAQSGKYYGLNEVGRRILELVSDPTSVSDLVSTLLLEYDVDRAHLWQDVLTFLKHMESEHLIQVMDETTA